MKLPALRCFCTWLAEPWRILPLLECPAVGESSTFSLSIPGETQGPELTSLLCHPLTQSCEDGFLCRHAWQHASPARDNGRKKRWCLWMREASVSPARHLPTLVSPVWRKMGGHGPNTAEFCHADKWRFIQNSLWQHKPAAVPPAWESAAEPGHDVFKKPQNIIGSSLAPVGR